MQIPSHDVNSSASLEQPDKGTSDFHACWMTSTTMKLVEGPQLR